MKKLSRLLTAFCLAAILTSGTITASANTVEKEPEIPVTIASNSNVAVPYSDVIETYFRTTTDGRLQYRHWNATRGRWVEPHWIDIN